MEENILKTEKISKLYIKFVIPAVISMLIVGIQQIIDGVFIGKFVGSNAMASVNITQPFVQLFFGCSMVICIGSVSYMGRALGEKNIDKARDIFKTSYISMFFLALFFLVLGVFLNKLICIVLGANELLLCDSIAYLRTYSFFIPIVSVTELFGFTDRIIGKPQIYLYATVISVFVNIVLDFIFIKYLQLGVMGAALATGISYIVALVVVIITLFKKSSTINLYTGKYKFNIIKVVLANGSSEGFTSIAIAITIYIFNITFKKFAGENGISAFAIINYIGLFGTLVMFGISDGISSILSYNYGAKNKKRVDETLIIAIIFNFLFGLLLFIIIMFFGKNLISLFEKDNVELIKLANFGSKLYAINFLFCGYNILKSGYFTAIGDAVSSVIISLSRCLVFNIIGVCILPIFFKINGVWLTVPFAEIITVLVCIIITKTKNKFDITSIRNK